MTLIAALAEKTKARLVMCICTRERDGFRLRTHTLPPLPSPQFEGDTAPTRAINAAVEDAIAQCPEQYLWSYNRYKQPGGAPPPPI
jgi:KDO2-lipid IV(A) lauroyltransferase